MIHSFDIGLATRVHRALNGLSYKDGGLNIQHVQILARHYSIPFTNRAETLSKIVDKLNTCPIEMRPDSRRGCSYKYPIPFKTIEGFSCCRKLSRRPKSSKLALYLPYDKPVAPSDIPNESEIGKQLSKLISREPEMRDVLKTSCALGDVGRELFNRNIVSVSQLGAQVPTKSWLKRQTEYLTGSPLLKYAVMYTTYGDRFINGAIRNGGIDDTNINYMKDRLIELETLGDDITYESIVYGYKRALDALFERAPPLDKDILVFRGQGSGVIDEKVFSGDTGYLYKNLGFVSTSLNLDKALRFATHTGELLFIRVPKGTKCLYLAEVSDHPDEKEILLPNFSTYYVLKKTKRDFVVGNLKDAFMSSHSTVYSVMVGVSKGEMKMRTHTPYINPYDNGYGTKVWRKFGLLHREDGPAIESYDVNKWYINGKLHREGGPAVEYRSGEKRWYRHGILHRDDGPAIEYKYGEKHWYIHGKLKMIEKDGNISHYDEGKLHGSPAVSSKDGKLKIWYKYGIKHRDDGPASIVIVTSGEIEIETREWYKDGLLHREYGPAKEQTNLNNLVIENSEWRINGISHRVGGPAIIRRKGGYSEEWLNHGIHHRDDGPAKTRIYEDYDGEVETIKEWYKDGKLNRSGGPARTVNTEGSDIKINVQEWFKDGELSNGDGPAKIREGVEKGVSILNREWHKNGRLHRDDGPAIVEIKEYNDGTKDTLMEWYHYGKPHREDGPAIEMSNGSTKWYIKGYEIISFRNKPATREIIDSFMMEQASLL